MKIWIDTNIYISHLLNPNINSPSNRIFKLVKEKKLEVVISDLLIEEILRVAVNKKYLTQRIKKVELVSFLESLVQYSQFIDKIDIEKRYTRDIKDDYAVAYALAGKANYLISGDDDLLSLGEIGRLKIVTPSNFVALSQKSSE